jgi:HEAT repeat protein
MKAFKNGFFVLFLLLAACRGSQDEWRKTESENSIPSYQEFIARHPKSKRADEARRKIEELSFAEVEAHETPQALMLFIGQFQEGPLVEKAERRLEDCAYRSAESQNSIKALEEFALRYPQSERSQQVHSKIEALRFEQAARTNTFASYRAFLEMHGHGAWAEKARFSLASLKSAVHPRLEDVRTLGLRVRESYAKAEDLRLPFDSIVKRIALYADLEFVGNDEGKADALVEITAGGEALGANYSGGWRYAGATLAGTVSLKVRQTTFEARAFSVRRDPPELILGDEGKTPSAAPFGGLLYAEHSFLENFLIIMGRGFGCHVIVPYLNDEDTSTSEKVVDAIIQVAGKSAYGIFESLSRQEEPHLQQAAMNGFGKLKDPRSVALLVKAMETGIGSVVSFQAAQALDNLGWAPPNAEIKVRHLMAKQDYKALARMGGTALGPLVHLLKDGDSPSLREGAARQLRVLELKEAFQPLIEALSDEAYQVRGEAALTLGALGNKDALMPLVGLLDDRIEDVRRHACWAMGDLRDIRAVEFLIKMMEYSELRDDIAAALRKITGKNFGQNQDNWQRWWEANKAGYFKLK